MPVATRNSRPLCRDPRRRGRSVLRTSPSPQSRGLIAQGILHIMAEYRNGFSKLLPAADVQRFAEGYVATSALAKRYHLDSGSLARYLRESGTSLLAIPLPDTGRGRRQFNVMTSWESPASVHRLVCRAQRVPRPPCFSATERTMNKPSPVPMDCRSRRGLTERARFTTSRPEKSAMTSTDPPAASGHG